MEMLSLYDYLNKAAGPELGKKVAKEATRQNVVIETKEVSNPGYKGKILMYPKTFLDSYFNPAAPSFKPEEDLDDLPF